MSEKIRRATYMKLKVFKFYSYLDNISYFIQEKIITSIRVVGYARTKKKCVGFSVQGRLKLLLSFSNYCDDFLTFGYLRL